MKVNGNDDSNAETLKTLNSDLKNKIAQKEKEIENVNKIFNKKIEEQAKIGEDSYLNRIDLNNQKLLSASTDFETKLKNYNNSLEKTKLELDLQAKNLKENNSTQIENLKNQFANNFKNTYENGSINEVDIQNKTHQELNHINDNAKKEISRMENNARFEMNALSSDYNNKSIVSEKDLRNRLDEDIKSHQEQIFIQKNQFKDDLDKTTDKNKRLELEKVRVQTDELKFLDSFHKNLMEQKQADFKIRFDNQSKEHDKILTDIKNKLAEDIRKAQLATETKMKSISARSDDPFYRIEKLEPKLTENAKNYFVSLNIPEHEKENVHLVAHGRNLKLTLSKKFEDNVVDEDGTFNKSSKSQLFSKEIATNDLVNPKKIAENYENGVLTFKVDKL